MINYKKYFVLFLIVSGVVLSAFYFFWLGDSQLQHRSRYNKLLTNEIKISGCKPDREAFELPKNRETPWRLYFDGLTPNSPMHESTLLIKNKECEVAMLNALIKSQQNLVIVFYNKDGSVAFVLRKTIY